MNVVTTLSLFDLLFLLITVGFGIASLRAWSRHRTAAFPTAKIVTHLSLQLAGIAVWVAFIIVGLTPLAWAAFIVLTVGQVVGDLLMFASYRARHPEEPKPGYFTMGGNVLSFSRPNAGFHALFGAIAWFGMLAICIYVTVAG